MEPVIFSPVSSFDSWSFVAAGTPASSIYVIDIEDFGGNAYYHTDKSDMSVLDRTYVALDAKFRAVAAWRLAQREILPYKLAANADDIDYAIDGLKKAVPDAKVGSLQRTLSSYRKAVAKVESRAKRAREAGTQAVAAYNARLMKVVNAVAPHLWDQDIGVWDPEPGWASATKFETRGQDIPALKKAIAALRKGKGADALKALRGVVCMKWGQYVSGPTYDGTVAIFMDTPYLNWADGFLPHLSRVHDEYTSIKAKTASGSKSFSAEIASLRTELRANYASLNDKIGEVRRAFARATAILE
jgi:hypothetical protein